MIVGQLAFPAIDLGRARGTDFLAPLRQLQVLFGQRKILPFDAFEGLGAEQVEKSRRGFERDIQALRFALSLEGLLLISRDLDPGA